MVRRSILPWVLLLAGTAFAGKGKIIDFKRLPQTDPGLIEFLAKASKDLPFRIAGALVLDTHIREKGHEVTNAAEADPVIEAVLGQVFDNMGLPNEIYNWDPNGFAPRSDMVCKEKVLIYPGRVSPTFSRKYTVKMAGKHIDQGYVGTDCTVTAFSAKTEEEWHEWTSKKGWGVNPHAVFVGENVARAAFTFYSKGSATVATPKVERPVYVGFVVRAKDTEAWKVLSVEQPISSDARKQECNAFPLESKPSDYEKKLRMANWMEAVRVLNPIHENFVGTEGTIFQLNGTGNDQLDPAKDKGLLEPYRIAASPLVRAAAELKLSRMGDPATPTVFGDLIATLKHPAARNELIRELVKVLAPRFNENAPANDADTKAMVELVSPDPKNPASVRELKIVDDIAKMRITGQKFDGWLFRKVDDGWQILGPIR